MEQQLTGLPDPGTCRAAAEAVLDWSAWCHRKVESLRLLEGVRGRRRISLDCTPPPDPALAYIEEERCRRKIRKVNGPIMVPLAIFAKQAMRDLDVIDSTGSVVPVLGRCEDSVIAWGALVHAVRTSLELKELHPTIIRCLRDITFLDADGARPLAERLLFDGTVENYQGKLDVDRLSGPVGDLIQDLAEGFLLVGLLPAEYAGTRQVLKFAFHWRCRVPASHYGGRTMAACGLRADPIYLDAKGVWRARSYHLEVHAPSGLWLTGLELPYANDTMSPAKDSELGAVQDVVAHARGTYSEPTSDELAVLWVRVPFYGIRLATLLVLVFVATVSVSYIVLPGAHAALLASRDGSVELLLAAPAVAMTYLARPGENVITAYYSHPLRVVITVCAAWLGGAAMSIAVGLHEPWMGLLWGAAAVLSSVAIVAVLSCPLLRRYVRPGY